MTDRTDLYTIGQLAQRTGLPVRTIRFWSDTGAQRQRMIDDFVDRVFDGIAPQSPGAHLATAMRQLPADLPDDPTTEQVDAWLELAELVGDTDPQADPTLVLTHAGAAHTDGVDPHSPQARTVLTRIVDPALTGDQRHRLAERITLFTDRRVERYWQLLGILNDRPPFPPSAAAFE